MYPSLQPRQDRPRGRPEIRWSSDVDRRGLGIATGGSEPGEGCEGQLADAEVGAAVRHQLLLLPWATLPRAPARRRCRRWRCGVQRLAPRWQRADARGNGARPVAVVEG